MSKTIKMNTQVLSVEELESVNRLNAEFNKAKMAIGDVELQKQNILRHIEVLKTEFAAQEKRLIEKYGKDCVVNLQTGEITIKKQ
jgi:hypothetical protein